MKKLAFLLLAACTYGQNIDGSVIYGSGDKRMSVSPLVLCKGNDCQPLAISKGRRDDDEPTPPPKPKGAVVKAPADWRNAGPYATVPESACGMDRQQATPNIDLIQVSCLDYDYLRAKMPEVAWISEGWATQVLIHVRLGTVAYISVDNGKTYQRQQLSLDAWGRLVALVEFKGLAAAKDIVVRVADERE